MLIIQTLNPLKAGFFIFNSTQMRHQIGDKLCNPEPLSNLCPRVGAFNKHYLILVSSCGKAEVVLIYDLDTCNKILSQEIDCAITLRFIKRMNNF